MWVSSTVGNKALILATCNSTSLFWSKLDSIFLMGVGDPIVMSPSLFVNPLTDLVVDRGVFKSYVKVHSY